MTKVIEKNNLTSKTKTPKNVVSVLNIAGEKVTTKNLNEEIWMKKFKEVTFSQALIRQAANKRRAIAHTKTRGEISGGGRKPFKQKGTGNARAGSTRSPLWIGGGVTFGPRNNRNWSKRIPQKLNSNAIKMVLSEKVRQEKFIVLDKFELSKISTKQVYDIFSKLPIKEGKILVILPELNVNTELSLANISYVKVIKVANINLFDISKFDYILTTVSGLEKIEESVK